MKIPFAAFGNDELGPPLKKGDQVQCSKCRKSHIVKPGIDKDGLRTGILLFYKCRRKMYLAGVGGRKIK